MEDIKLSLFENNMIIFVENQKELTKKIILELISNYSKNCRVTVGIKASIYTNKCIKKYPTLMDRKIQYSKDISSSQLDV